MARGFALRKTDGSWTEKLAALDWTDPISGDVLKGEQFALYGGDARPIPLVQVSDSQASGAEYPKSGTAIGGSTTTISFPSTVTVDPTGLLVLLTNDTPSGALGQLRRVNSVTGSSGSYVATVGKWNSASGAYATLAWSGGISIGASTTFSLLVDLIGLARLHIVPEFQNAKATDPSAVLNAILYGRPQTASGAASAPIPFADRDTLVANNDRTTDSAQSGYRQGDTYTIEACGAIGAKVRLVTAPSGKLALWAFAT